MTSHEEPPLRLPLAPHAQEADAVAAELRVDPTLGLAAEEAARRRDRWGPNTLDDAGPRPLWRTLLASLAEPFVLLLIAAGLGAVALGEVRDGLLVLVGLVPIVAADALTSYRGERALAALRAAAAPRARVRREGRVLDLAASELVPGDVVLVAVGDVVPADLRLIRTEGLQIDRAVLTGESLPQLGRVAPDPPDAPLLERHSLAFAGTAVVAGRGEGIVVATGRATEVGRIAASLGPRPGRRSPVQAELDRLTRILVAVAAGLVATTSGLGFLRGRPPGENLLAGISAAIAAVPEEPPVLVAVVLGLGAYRLLRRGVLVRRLTAEETLGAVDLVVTDKTGTLTENRLVVAAVRRAEGPVGSPEVRRELLAEALWTEEDAWAMRRGAPPSAFTRALLAELAAGGLVDPPVPGELVAAESPRDGHPYSRTRIRRSGEVEEAALGAPEAIFDLVGLRGLERSRWEAELASGARRGERLLALARRRGTGPWEVRALIGFTDPLRTGVREALRTAQGAGIQVLVMTGDHPETAAAVARAAGLPAEAIHLADQLRDWTDEALVAALSRLSVVARATPADKERVVRLARRAGRTVAVTGDGVNDAPALQEADVGVAMGSGTAVAREAADLVLGDDSLATLIYGLAEGRRIVDNVLKGLTFLLSSHVALLGFILIATLVGVDQPLLPIQILWLELFIDTTTSVAFEREPPEADLMTRPPRRRGAPLLSVSVLAGIVVGGGMSAAAALCLMVAHGGGFTHARWLAFTSLVAGQVVRAHANRSLRWPVWRLTPNAVLLAAGALVLAVQASIPAVEPLREAFRATPLDMVDWLLVGSAALAPALVAHLVRLVSRRPWVA
jgi:Ca2+-transporting ATPase